MVQGGSVRKASDSQVKKKREKEFFQQSHKEKRSKRKRGTHVEGKRGWKKV